MSKPQHIGITSSNQEPGMQSTQPRWLSDLAISDTGFVFDPYSGTTYNVNATGLQILKGIRAGLGRGALLESIDEAFETAGRDVERDLDDFVHMLRQRGLVPQHFALEA